MLPLPAYVFLFILIFVCFWRSPGVDDGWHPISVVCHAMQGYQISAAAVSLAVSVFPVEIAVFLRKE